MWNLSCENEFYLHENNISFSHQQRHTYKGWRGGGLKNIGPWGLSLVQKQGPGLDPPLHLALLWNSGLKQLWHGILSEIKTTVVCKDESQNIRLTYIMSTIFLATLACVTNGTKLWLSPSAKQRRNPCSRPPPVSNHLSTCHDWPCYKCHCWFANQVTGIFKMYIL